MRWPNGKDHALKSLQQRHEREKAHDFVIRELELGKRAAVLFGNEVDGWGPWVDTSGMFEINLNPVALQSDWTRGVEGEDPYLRVSPKRSGVHNPSPTAENPIAFPQQRAPSE